MARPKKEKPGLEGVDIPESLEQILKEGKKRPSFCPYCGGGLWGGQYIHKAACKGKDE